MSDMYRADWVRFGNDVDTSSISQSDHTEPRARLSKSHSRPGVNFVASAGRQEQRRQLGHQTHALVSANWMRTVDFLIVAVTGYVAMLGWQPSLLGTQSAVSLFVIINVAALTVLRLEHHGRYGGLISAPPAGGRHHMLAGLLTGTLLVMLVAGVVAQSKRPDFALLSIWMVSAALTLWSTRVAFYGPIVRAIANGRLRCRLAIVGDSELASAFAAKIASSNGPYEVMGRFRVDPVSVVRPSNATGTLDSLLDCGRRNMFDAVVIVQSGLPSAAPDDVLYELREVVAEIFWLPDWPAFGRPDRSLPRLGDVPVIQIVPRALNASQARQKATVDRALGCIAIVATLPLFAVIALLIRMDSPGPALFRQRRIGYNNRSFNVFKFRSFYEHLSDTAVNVQTSRGDPRVTRVGRWLRKLSLDELPQLINVLRGEMSLVGPRPHAPQTSVNGFRFDEAHPDYAARHRVKPGITGWAQVNGARGPIDRIEQLQQRVAYDLEYIEGWSLWLDIKILVLTFAREIVSERAF